MILVRVLYAAVVLCATVTLVAVPYCLGHTWTAYVLAALALLMLEL